MQSRRSESTVKVFVGSLPPNVTTDDLRRLFAPYGVIAECDIANRCGFLHLEDKDLAEKAIEELNNTTFMGGRISVEKGRVKPPGRRGRSLGPMRGGDRDRGGPYSRDRPRNGGYERDFPPYGGDRFEYDKPMPPRSYEGYGDRRPAYDDRRAFGQERRPYPNGYERRPAYADSRAVYDVPRSGYDDRRVPPGPGDYEDRRSGVSERRPIQDPQDVMGGAPRPLMTTYERQAATDMYSRRDNGPKPLIAGQGNAYERPAVPSYSVPAVAASYSPVQGVSGGYAVPSSGAYGAAGYGTAGGYGDARGGYGDRAPQLAAAGGYSDVRGPAAAAYPDARAAAGYVVASQSYENTGGYGDSYGTGRGSYDTSYPPLPQRGGRVVTT